MSSKVGDSLVIPRNDLAESLIAQGFSLSSKTITPSFRLLMMLKSLFFSSSETSLTLELSDLDLNNTRSEMPTDIAVIIKKRTVAVIIDLERLFSVWLSLSRFC